MAENKTQPTAVPVLDYLHHVMPEGRRRDGLWLDQVFRRVTGWQPKMWGPTMIGYGAYHYKYDSGHEGECLATGFAPRKANMVLYIMPGYSQHAEPLARLGKHKRGKSCIYLGAMKNINEAALEDLIRAGLQDLQKHWPVMPS
ncbi:MAG: DUF1801 domain-containing protein [Rhodobacteraceae bacterium]|nr:DUF1801 domain-containing protein [Paracoccaceae bacterium]